MIEKLLADRSLPPLKERDKMLDIMLREVYGYLPDKPEKLTFEAVHSEKTCAGKATLKNMVAHCTLKNGEFSFPFNAVIPKSDKKVPFFVHINFRDCVPDRYMPTEELVDNGFAVLSFCHRDVTYDNADMADGIYGLLYPDGKRGDSDAGKISVWAWAAQRVMDYAYTLGDLLDLSRGIVCGHSRLGKTALLTAATDQRFWCAYSNDSGCTGAAISRGKKGESVTVINNAFPLWFCENYKTYNHKEYAMPFDQHYLVASIAPRYVCVGSATEDDWADPVSEQLCCAAASPAFENEGKAGFVHKGELAKSGEAFFEGSIGYHLREGSHYFSRTDWLRLIEFVRLKIKS